MKTTNNCIIIDKDDTINYKYLSENISLALSFLEVRSRSTYYLSDEKSYYFFRAISDFLAESTLLLVKLKKSISKKYKIPYNNFDIDFNGHLIKADGVLCSCCLK